MRWGGLKRALLPSAAAIFSASSSIAQLPFAPPQKYLLVPIDDRPATSQFAKMIGRIADIDIETPPDDLLGIFTTPGAPEKVLDWLSQKNLSQYDAVIVSTDMICYGGLIASREFNRTTEQAMGYLKRFEQIRARAPQVPFYGFSATMRLSPTSTLKNTTFRTIVPRAAINLSRFCGTLNLGYYCEFIRLARLVPRTTIDSYLAARERNSLVQAQLLRTLRSGVFDFLIVGQDDAQPEGPQIAETEGLKDLADIIGVRPKVYFCEGIDQHSNVLCARALVKSQNWTPKVRIVYADPQSAKIIPPYETSPIEQSLLEQITASGAKAVFTGDDYDYSIYVNTPSSRPDKFKEFTDSLVSDIDQGFPTAVADINLGKSGTGDPNLFAILDQEGRSQRLLAYAGWNTAGNTIGTTIPAANVYLTARRMTNIDPLQRELNQKEFLLHRLVNDFEYHRFTRPQAYAMIDKTPGASREETYGAGFDKVNDFVKKDLGIRLNSIFDRQFKGQKFFAGTHQYVLQSLDNVDVHLPWPRVYEVSIGFSIRAKEVIQGQ